MEIEQSHRFDQSEARERVRALGDYLANKHGMSVQWLDENTAHIRGKYTVVTVDAQVTIGSANVRVSGKDPGMLWRMPAKKYVSSKLEKYLDPREAKETLPRE